MSWPGFHLKYTFNRMLMFCNKMLQINQYSIHSKHRLLVEDTSLAQGKNTIIMFIWCLKQLKDFILKFSISETFLILFLQADVLLRLPTTEQIIKDTNMIFIFFSIIHWQPYISWIISNFLKFSELFLIYAFV